MELMKDEHIIYETHVSYIVSALYFIFALLFFKYPVFMVLVIIYSVSVFQRKFILTDKRFIKKTWFSSNEMRLEKIETVKKKGVFWSGVQIHWTGSGKIVAKSIDNPQKLINEIHQALDNLKR